MTKNKSKRVVFNLIQAEVYAQNPELLTGKKGVKSPVSYVELRERVAGNAVFEELVEVPYPVTPESVASFEASTDYKRDIESAMNAPARGVNLGDIVDMQRVMAMDKEEAQKLVASLNQKIMQSKTAEAVEKKEGEVTEK